MMKAGNNSEDMSVSHSVGNRAGGKIARDGRDDGAGKLGAEIAVRMAGKIGAKIFVGVASGEIGFEKAFDGFGNVFRGASISDLTGNAGVFADGAADAEVIGVNQLRALLDFFAFQANIGDPVLAAGIRAARDVQLERLIKFRDAFFEFLDEPASEGLRFGDGEFAEFSARAGHRTTPER